MASLQKLTPCLWFDDCGWVKDKFGLSWQVIPRVMNEMIEDPDQEKSNRVFAAMLRMKKLDIAELKHAYEGA